VVEKSYRTTDPGKQKVIAYVTDGIVPSIASSMLGYAAEYAKEKHSCIVQFISYKPPFDPVVVRGYDGIIADISHRDSLDSILATGLPVVTTSIMDVPGNYRTVDFSPELSGKMAAEWFLRHRFTSFAYCSAYGTAFYERLGAAFAETVGKAGFGCVTCDPEAMNVASMQAKANSVPEYLDEWIRTLPPRTAVFCMHDLRAMRVIESCLRLGRAVPDDIAVMGLFNDVLICTSAPTAITSIDPGIRRQMYTALQMLEEMIDDPEAAKKKKTTLIPPLGVVERESTNVYPVDPPWLAKALMLIDERIGQRVSVADLADATGVSQTSLQLAFNKSFGISANKYIMSVKMREAKRLLDCGEYSVKELAARTGFSTPSYFTRAYTNYYGHSPTTDRPA